MGAEDDPHAARSDLSLELEPIAKQISRLHWNRSRPPHRRELLNSAGFNGTRILRYQRTSGACGAASLYEEIARRAALGPGSYAPGAGSPSHARASAKVLAFSGTPSRKLVR